MRARRALRRPPGSCPIAPGGFGGRRMFGLENAQSLLGVAVTIGICWALSEKRSAFPWKLTLGALAVQAGLVFLLFGLPWTRGVLSGAGMVVQGLSDSTEAGVKFVFGYLAGGDQPYPVQNGGLL